VSERQRKEEIEIERQRKEEIEIERQRKDAGRGVAHIKIWIVEGDPRDGNRGQGLNEL
jgi:hypothetical protein